MLILVVVKNNRKIGNRTNHRTAAAAAAAASTEYCHHAPTTHDINRKKMKTNHGSEIPEVRSYGEFPIFPI